MAKTQLRLLLVGVGQRTRSVLLPALAAAALPVRVSAVCDPTPDIADHVNGLVADSLLGTDVVRYNDLPAALNGGDYELAIVACPHDEHQRVALMLADAGIGVWKEKPYALTLDDALSLAAHPGPGLRILAHRPHGNLYQLAAEKLAVWGRLLSYRIRITRQTGDYSTTWRASRRRAGGGAILDLGYHAFDLISRLADQPAAVYAVATTSPAHRTLVEVEENAHLIVTHASGCAGTLYLSRCTDSADELDLVAEYGRITISGERARIQTVEQGGLTSVVELTAHDNPWARMMRYHIQTFTDPVVTAAETRIGVQATALMEAAYTSLRLGRPAPVDIPYSATLEGLPA